MKTIWMVNQKTERPESDLHTKGHIDKTRDRTQIT